MGVLPPKSVLTILIAKICNHHALIQNPPSLIVFRTVLYVLTLKISMFPKPLSNISVQNLFKNAHKQVEMKHLLQVS